jgi:hypothetical protein
MDMLTQLALIHGVSKRDINCHKYIVRHKARQGKRGNKGDYKKDEKKGEKAIRVRKNLLQQRVLEREFQQAISPSNGRQNVWSKDKIKDLAKKVGLSEGQIYKWQWDRQNKRDASPDS